MAIQCDTFPVTNPCDTFPCTEAVVTLKFVVLDSVTRKPIPGVTWKVNQGSNVLGEGIGSSRGKFSAQTTIMVTSPPVSHRYTYSVEKGGYLPKFNVVFRATGSTDILILMELASAYPAVLMLVLDQTGSIGVGGAQAGIAIIDRTDVQAIGYVSFGDVIVQQRAITTNLALVREELEYAATHPGASPFFGDGGGDTPENGVDALAAGLDLLAGFSGVPGGTRALYMKTDTAGFAHQTQSPSVVNTRLNLLSAVWLEFGNLADGEEEGFYLTTFPETAVVSHDAFPIPV